MFYRDEQRRAINHKEGAEGGKGVFFFLCFFFEGIEEFVLRNNFFDCGKGEKVHVKTGEVFMQPGGKTLAIKSPMVLIGEV